MLGVADHYVSPSRFLGERYVAWGLDPERLSIIDNGIDVTEAAPARPLVGPGARRSRFAFSGR